MSLSESSMLLRKIKSEKYKLTADTTQLFVKGWGVSIKLADVILEHSL